MLLRPSDQCPCFAVLDRQAEILTDLLASDIDGHLAARVERITEVQRARRKVTDRGGTR